ncbi:hypothetical protein LINPERHAP2_LOCUS27523 [Linum perenne]
MTCKRTFTIARVRL